VVGDLNIEAYYNELILKQEASTMKRKITERLISWKNRESGRMPLLVYGARQVGKTHILREFGE
jgi:predicted AAA+ superfamily ATPase